MQTFPLSQLPSNMQDFHAKYAGTQFVTFVKGIEFPNQPTFWRGMIGFFSEIDSMLKEGWKVIDATK